MTRRIAALILAFVILGTCITFPYVDVEAAETKNVTTANELLSQIKVGINIGNSLDSCVDNSKRNSTNNTKYYETAWHNPVISRKLIDSVKAAGFNAVRIPVTWYYNTYVNEEGQLVINTSWLKRVAEVVDYCISKNMYVVLDSHHDHEIIWAGLKDINQVSNNVVQLWTQIAYYFRDYDEHLIFEGFNEINTKNNSWTYNKNSVLVTNTLNQLFVSTVRMMGSNNAKRFLICGTYLHGVEQKTLDGFVLPTDTIDNHLIIAVHSYDNAYDQGIDTLFDKLQKFSKRAGAPVLIDEFGTLDSYQPATLRAVHAGNFVSRAAEKGIKCFWWDDGGNYALFDRNTGNITKGDIIDKLMAPVKYQTNSISSITYNSVDDYVYNSIDSKTGSFISWDKGALTLNTNGTGMAVTPGVTYKIKLINEGDSSGLCMNGVAFYDINGTFLSFTKPGDTNNFSIMAPQGAAYMRVTFYNPWNVRTISDYISYIEKGLAYLSIEGMII